jgi:hypothetical protein
MPAFVFRGATHGFYQVAPGRWRYVDRQGRRRGWPVPTWLVRLISRVKGSAHARL